MKGIIYILFLYPVLLSAQLNNTEGRSKLTLTDGYANTRLSLDSCKLLAIHNNYSIKEAASEVLQKKMVNGEYLPQLAVGVAGVYTDMMDKTNKIGIAFATLSIPISDWWGGSHKIRHSNAKVGSALNRFSQTSELLALQITQVQNELSQSYFQIEIAGKSVEQARENLDVTKDNYDAGITNMSELLEAQSVYQDAINRLSEAKCNYLITRARYMQAINMYQ